METGIYKIENNINHKIYIGQAQNIQRRWKDHKTHYNNESDHNYNSYLYRAMRKYGIQNFTFSIVELCLVEQLNEKEKYWIEYYDSYFNGYNVTLGGDGSGTAINKEKVIGIFNDLKNTSLLQREIAEKWGMSEEMVQGINTGRYWHRDIEYPIRKQFRRPQNHCIDCNKEITYTATRCPTCEAKRRKRVFTDEERATLKEQIRKYSFLELSRMYGYNDNTIRKWCMNCNLPYKKREIQKYTDEEWEKI